MNAVRSFAIGVAAACSFALAVNVISLVTDNPPVWLFWLLHLPALLLLPLLSFPSDGPLESLVDILLPVSGGSTYRISIAVLALAIVGWSLAIAIGHYLWTRFLNRHMRRLTRRWSGPPDVL